MSHSAGLDIEVTEKGFAEGDSASIDIALREMKDSGLIVFLAIFFDSDLDYVMTQAQSLGITGSIVAVRLCIVYVPDPD